ncbi:serine hydrolase [uncultured Streptomyces sp.]|uniref:serine hydrolase domain-containing protein n=1 Tax=uncultured Streptomyces sp. TaxID=174707 RepID=UPI002602A6E4|nr:serine hydrolase domain-containing protein [uncultured Streptomyces sp.]
MTIRRNKTKASALVAAVCATTLTLAAHGGTAYADTGDHAATLAALRTLQAAAGPGAAVHAGTDGEDWTLSAGTGTYGAARPIREDEHFLIGSQTKSFTATVVLQLADEGRVDLDAPVETYLPGVVTGNGYDGTRITVRHLLRHTSGIASYSPGLPGSFTVQPPRRPDGTYDPREVVRTGLTFDPVSVPGAAYTYSNTNYVILGLLVEAVTGAPVREAVRSRLIEPLGLARTFFPAPGERTLPLPAVTGYHGARLGGLYLWYTAEILDPSLYGSAGAMVSTLEDVTAFYTSLLAGELLSPASLAEMKEVSDPGSGVGLSSKVMSCGITAWGHSGMLPGYFSYTMVTEDGRHASAMTNAAFQINPPSAQMLKVVDTALCES